MKTIEDIDHILNNDCWKPRWGWHDDHRHCGNPATADYLPAMMQVRDEVKQLLDVIGPREESCLQLGLGPCMACHEVWRYLFKYVVTIDQALCLVGNEHRYGLNTHDPAALVVANEHAPYDLLFIDAGHSYNDAYLDHVMYRGLMKPNGIIAFHDALPRAAYPELGVPGYLDFLRHQKVEVNMIGTEVGIAWIQV